MAHVGHELRLVLARDLEFTAFLSNLAEQARVLHRNGGLTGEGLDQANDLRREGTRLVAPDDQYAHDLPLVQQRDSKNRSHACAQKDVEQRRRRRVTKVSNLNDLTSRSAFADNNTIETHRLRPHHGNVLVAHVVSGREPEVTGCLIKYVHSATTCIRHSAGMLDSMAITAWSAKVFSSPTSLSGNGPGAARATMIMPIGAPSRSMGTKSPLRQPIARDSACC